MNLFPSFVIDKRRFYSKNSTHLFVVLPNKGTRVRVNSNYVQPLLIGLCIGVTLGIAVIPLFDSFDCQNSFMESEYNAIVDPLVIAPVELDGQNGRLDLNGNNPLKTLNVQSHAMNMRRPRFYSTELGLRKKLMVGIVLTDHMRIDNLIAINKTLSPFVDQTLFFVVGQSEAKQVRSLGLSNVVTLPDSIKSTGVWMNKSGESGGLGLNKSMYNRAGLKVMKYFGGKVVDNYDYFFIGLDVFYINGRGLINAVKRISISQDFLWGIAEDTGCSLEKGFVLSRSFVRKLSSRIDRCFQRSLLTMSNNLTKCVQYALGSAECSDLVQNQRYVSVSAESFNEKSLSEIPKVISIGPVSSFTEFFQLHMKISDKRMIEIDQEIKETVRIIDEMAPHMPKGFDISSWPKGLPMSYRPVTRFDVLKWKYFTLNKIYPRNEHITESVPDGIDELDIYSVVNASSHYIRHVLHRNDYSSITFRYGYRRFDETRGMEYLLDFFSNADGQIHRVECIRPLSKIEVVPMPFVTENRQLTIIMPVMLDQYNLTNTFLKSYFDTRVDKKTNAVLMLAIIVNDSNSIVGHKLNLLHSIKKLVSEYNSNQRTKDNGNTASLDTLKVGYVLVNMRQFKTSNFALAVLDTLAGRVLSPNALVLIIDSFIVLKDEFLNRVRMNTILNYQVFSPIPFMEYNPRISGHKFNEKGLDIHKTTGYFDSKYFGFFSFFVADFIAVRKHSLSVVLEAETNHIGVSILPTLFLRGSKLHVLRAPEPNLKIRFQQDMFKSCLSEECFKTQWGSKAELAKLILHESA